MVSGLTTGDSDHPYEQCQFAVIDTPDPDADSSWNLLNSKGFWSLEVAAFKGFPGRKQAAVDAVKQFRAAGVPAYFYHGPAISSVCIGAWPREAVKEQDMASAQVDPDSAVLVLPDTLPKGMVIPNNLETPDGQHVQAVAPRVEVVDPTLQQAMKDYPYHAVNGEVGRMITQPNGQQVESYNPSFLVPIPEKPASLLTDQSAGMNPNASAMPAPPPQIGGPGAGSWQDAQPPQNGAPPQNGPAQGPYPSAPQPGPSQPSPSQPSPSQADPQPDPGVGRLRSIGG
jgi:hypothetical protein